MRDLYPQHARLRRSVENQLLRFFDLQGFEMVSCGAFEYVETLSRGRLTGRLDRASQGSPTDAGSRGDAGGRGADIAEQLVQWFDADGKAVALRPDMTPSIARMAAPLLSAERPEVRWCYAERVYHRTNDPASLSWASGRAAESTQVGVEWIGAGGSTADARLIQLCQEGLAAIGLPDWQMVVSHAVIAPALLATFGIAQDSIPPLLAMLSSGDYVGFQQRTRQLGVDRDVLQLFSRCDPYEPATLQDFLPSDGSVNGSEVARAAWAELASLADTLKRQGLAARVAFDLALHRDVSYYTGLVFEVFSPGVGAPVAVGGRYDDLLAQFGAAAPAVGFTFEVERVLAVLTQGAWLSGDGEGSSC